MSTVSLLRHLTVNHQTSYVQYRRIPVVAVTMPRSVCEAWPLLHRGFSADDATDTKRETIHSECKEFDVSNIDRYEDPRYFLRLSASHSCNWRVIFLPEEKLLVAASQDNAVRVYHIDSSGEPCAVFNNHSDWVRDVTQLNGDLVASVGGDNMLFSWCASTAELIDSWKCSTWLRAVSKLDDSRVIVGDFDGAVTVLTHKLGKSFQLIKRLPNAHFSWLNDIVVHRELTITCSKDHTVKLWDATSIFRLGTHRYRKSVSSAAANDNNIVTVGRDGTGMFMCI